MLDFRSKGRGPDWMPITPKTGPYSMPIHMQAVIAVKSHYMSFPVRKHRSEIMFGVLVVVLRPDHVAGQGFSSG